MTMNNGWFCPRCQETKEFDLKQRWVGNTKFWFNVCPKCGHEIKRCIIPKSYANTEKGRRTRRQQGYYLQDFNAVTKVGGIKLPGRPKL